MNRWAVGAALTLILTPNAASAAAGLLSTGPLESRGNANVAYVCSMTNLDKKQVEVIMSMVNANGQVEPIALALSIPPGHNRGLLIAGDKENALRCQIEGKFSSKKTLLTFSLRSVTEEKTLVAITAP